MKKNILALLLAMTTVLPLGAATLTSDALRGAKAYPNPWKIDKHAALPVTFEGMPSGSVIKIFTVSGRFVKELIADSSGSAGWDRTNDSGQAVASGVYIYLIIDPQGNDASGKIVIIK